jgi:hypothetical protein
LVPALTVEDGLRGEAAQAILAANEENLHSVDVRGGLTPELSCGGAGLEPGCRRGTMRASVSFNDSLASCLEGA